MSTTVESEEACTEKLAVLIALAQSSSAVPFCACASPRTPPSRAGRPLSLPLFLCVFSFYGVPVLVPVRASPVPSVKKENRQPKGGMGGRHAATTQGF